ncbi:uncharacterized protein K489DRAFT_367137 [Dissoconium aciculare CBS 342.82]|uniref:Uncharacterized protein n=1 Tax=Dissoconium aciculare CBS 342.82 TaxID=1314786 RepID=A0A6J3MG40_9PEZI|nr:uncharacterized protein K489DRAFT_367137 [Dissoconium aciculare CBS 342.82]KAF1825857.1 hypothetical protein K489DRAFT_367137 [Dissoconium aciculare CBS 342.82]
MRRLYLVDDGIDNEARKAEGAGEEIRTPLAALTTTHSFSDRRRHHRDKNERQASQPSSKDVTWSRTTVHLEEAETGRMSTDCGNELGREILGYALPPHSNVLDDPLSVIALTMSVAAKPIRTPTHDEHATPRTSSSRSKQRQHHYSESHQRHQRRRSSSWAAGATAISPTVGKDTVIVSGAARFGLSELNLGLARVERLPDELKTGDSLTSATSSSSIFSSDSSEYFSMTSDDSSFDHDDSSDEDDKSEQQRKVLRDRVEPKVLISSIIPVGAAASATTSNNSTSIKGRQSTGCVLVAHHLNSDDSSSKSHNVDHNNLSLLSKGRSKATTTESTTTAAPSNPDTTVIDMLTLISHLSGDFSQSRPSPPSLRDKIDDDELDGLLGLQRAKSRQKRHRSRTKVEDDMPSRPINATSRKLASLLGPDFHASPASAAAAASSSSPRLFLKRSLVSLRGGGNGAAERASNSSVNSVTSSASTDSKRTANLASNSSSRSRRIQREVSVRQGPSSSTAGKRSGHGNVEVHIGYNDAGEDNDTYESDGEDACCPPNIPLAPNQMRHDLPTQLSHSSSWSSSYQAFSKPSSYLPSSSSPSSTYLSSASSPAMAAFKTTASKSTRRSPNKDPGSLEQSAPRWGSLLSGTSSMSSSKQAFFVDGSSLR